VSTPCNIRERTAASTPKTRSVSSHRGSSRRRRVAKQPQTPLNADDGQAATAARPASASAASRSLAATSEVNGDFIHFLSVLHPLQFSNNPVTVLSTVFASL